MSISNFTRNVTFLFLRIPYSFQLLHMRRSPLTCQTSSSEGSPSPLTVLQALPRGVFFLKKAARICSPLPCMPCPRLLMLTTYFQPFSSTARPVPCPGHSCVHRSPSVLCFCTSDPWGVLRAPGPHPRVTTECPQTQPHPGPKRTWPQEGGGCIWPFVTCCLSALPAHGLISLQPAQP